jgi:hypothetical protein
MIGSMFFLSIGLPSGHFVYVKNVKPGMPLFLFNYSDRKMHGIFEAACAGQLNIDRFAWSDNGRIKTQFPAQVSSSNILFIMSSTIVLCMVSLVKFHKPTDFGTSSIL